MPVHAVIAVAASVLLALGLALRREMRLRAAEAAKEAVRAAKLSPFLAALRQERVPHAEGLTLTFDVGGVIRSTPVVMADRDAAALRFVAPYACLAVHRSEPTGWGDWSWTDLYFRPSDCACGGPQATLYRFRPYRFDHGDGIGPDPIAAICLDCHEARGEDGMDEDDIAFVHRCRAIACAVSRGATPEGGPYRSAA